MALREQGLIDWEAWSDGIKRRDLSGIAGQHLITPEMKARLRSIDASIPTYGSRCCHFMRILIDTNCYCSRRQRRCGSC